jgi:hypothetical protein
MRRGGKAETTREGVPGQGNRSFVSSLSKQPVGHPQPSSATTRQTSSATTRQASSATTRQAAKVELTDIYTTTRSERTHEQSNFSRQHR